MELVPGTCAERYLAFKNTQGSQITYEDIDAEKVRLGLDKHFELKEYCDGVGIGFMSSVFSEKDARLLNKVVADYVKIPSFESNNDKLINYCSRNFDELIIST